MKANITQLRRMMITIASIVLLSGIFYAVPAGQGHHFPGTNRVVTQDTGVAGSPAPVVDDTPINPDSSARIKSGGASRNFGPVKQQQNKRKMNPR
jgi:hypothetical protein